MIFFLSYNSALYLEVSWKKMVWIFNDTMVTIDDKTGRFVPHNQLFVDGTWSKYRGWGPFEIWMFKTSLVILIVLDLCSFVYLILMFWIESLGKLLQSSNENLGNILFKIQWHMNVLYENIISKEPINNWICLFMKVNI